MYARENKCRCNIFKKDYHYTLVVQVHLSSLRFMKTHFEIYHLTMLLPPIATLSLYR